MTIPSDEHTGWTSECPTETGEYEIRCFETEFEPERVSIYIRHNWKPLPALCVRDDLIGECPLHHYHQNLTNLQWRKL